MLILNASQVMDAVRFDGAMNAVHTDGSRPDQIEALFRTASLGAETVAQQYRAAGNAGSAAFYQKIARDYREPPFE